MRFTTFPAIPALLAAVAVRLVTQDGSARELERICDRAVSDTGPASARALEERLRAETGGAAAFLRGCRRLAARDFGPAGAEFERAVKAAPGEPVYHFWFGRATGEQAQRASFLRQPGLARRTKGEFEKAVELDPMYIPAREGLVRYYIAAPGAFGGSLDRAREQARAITQLDAYRGGLAHANVAIAGKDTAALVAAHEGLVRQYPDSVVPRLALANVHLARREWSRAWLAVDGVQQLRPGWHVGQYLAGRAAAESGEQLERGESALREYLRSRPAPNEPSHAAAHWRLGVIAEHRGDTSSARRAYEASLALDPGFTQARTRLDLLRRR